MSTRGVIAVRKNKGDKPKYYYIKQDAYPEYAGEYLKGGIKQYHEPEEYIRGVSEKEYKDSMKKYQNESRDVRRNFSEDRKRLPEISPMNDIEAKNYLMDDYGPAHYYEANLDEGELKHYKLKSRYDCGPDEEYMGPYYKDDGTYVHGHCRKKQNKNKRRR